MPSETPSDLSSVDANNCRNIVDEDRLWVEPQSDHSAARAISAYISPMIDKDGIMADETQIGYQAQLEERRLMQRQQSSSDNIDAKQRTSISSTQSDTDDIAKMMFELWGSKNQVDNIPPEEIVTPLTKNIEKIVARQMYEMNRAEREAIVEGLHGVKSRAVAESPNMITSALEDFREEAELLCKGKVTDVDINDKNHPIGKAHLRALEILDSNYVIAPEFRIRFLRTEFFDVEKAVLRYCRYLNHVWDLFGDLALVRQIALNDLNKKELKYLKGGNVQGLLSRDKMGRRIYALFGTYDVPIRDRARVETYLSFVAISDDQTTQINGATILVFFSLNEKSVIKYDKCEHRIIRKMTNCMPVRYTAMHFCMPNESVYNFFKSWVYALIRPEMRASTRFHTGSQMECKYSLCQFGIPIDDIPTSVAGAIKSRSIQKFIKARVAMEEYRSERCRLMGVRYVTKAMEDELVESYPPPSLEALERFNSLKGFPPSCPGTDCPELDCIVFGDRVTYRHPPNVKFRDYLWGKRHRQEELKEQERQQNGKEKHWKERIFSAEFLDEIIDEALTILGCKFVTYDKDAGWYAYIKPNTPENRQVLRKKISQLMRDERKRERASKTLSSGLDLAAVAEAASRGGGNYSEMSSNMGLGAKRFKNDAGFTGGNHMCG
jgi:hypothetical protein